MAIDRMPIAWSITAIADLRRLANGGVRNQFPLEVRLAPALIEAAEGRFAEAETSVLRVADENSDPTALTDPVFFPLLVAFFIVQRFDKVGQMLRERWGLNCAVEVCLGSPSPGFACVRWEIVSKELMRFAFDHTILGPDNVRNRLLAFHWLFPLFAEYMRSGAGETGQVTISLWDTGLAPGLAFCSNSPHHFLIPDNLFISTRAYERVRLSYRQNDVKWHDRLPVAFWRGTTTGRPTDPSAGWRSLPRIKLCKIAKENSSLFDVGISGITQISDPNIETELTRLGILSEFIPATEFNRYKYHIDIDGNTNSWPGLFQKLLTGSPVVKVTSRTAHKQWYYDRLKPWINFVPVRADMSDLLEQVTWLKQHDDDARAIGEQGGALAQSLDYEGELGRARNTIDAALRFFGGQL